MVGGSPGEDVTGPAPDLLLHGGAKLKVFASTLPGASFQSTRDLEGAKITVSGQDDGQAIIIRLNAREYLAVGSTKSEVPERSAGILPALRRRPHEFAPSAIRRVDNLSPVFSRSFGRHTGRLQLSRGGSPGFTTQCPFHPVRRFERFRRGYGRPPASEDAEH